jgi:hypothetical protein
VLFALIKERRSLVRRRRGADWKPSLLVALRSSRKELAHIVVGSLRKVFVVLANSLKEWGRAQADGFIRFLCKLLASVWRSDRHCYDDFRGIALPQGLYRCAHSRASGQSIIDQNDDFIAQLRCGAAFTKNLFAPLKFGCLFGRYRFNCLACEWYCAHNILIQNAHTARRDRASGELFETRDAKFADDEGVEWCAQALRYFISNWNATTWQTEYDYILPPCIFLEFLCQLPASFCSIWKSSLHSGIPFEVPEILS